MLLGALTILSTTVAASAIPYGSSIETLVIREVGAVTTTGICGAYNGSATCTGSGFGSCCSQFGYCGSTSGHCGTGCQSGYGSCGTLPSSTWSSLGCLTDSTLSRTLNTSVLVAGNTIEKCQAACLAKGFTYAGVEYGSQCFCGTAVQNSPSTSTGCTMACAGDATETCGGSNAINVYSTIPQWDSLGCYSDNTLSRTLNTSINIAGNTNAKCKAACYAAGFNYAGTEYGTQCFCGTAIMNGGAAIASSSCSTACAGDSSEVCGGSNSLSLFQLDDC